MRRKKLSMKKSKKMYKSNLRKNSRNNQSARPMRGGYRL